MKITFVEQNLDSMGGVERIINTIANELSKSNLVNVVNETKKNKEFYFKYNKAVVITNIIDETNDFINNINKKNLVYYFFRFLQRTKEKTKFSIVPKKIQNIFNNSDVIVFGRTTVMLKYARYLVKIKNKDKKIKIIVRDAAHMKCVSKKNRERIIKYFPKCVDVLIVSSDESMNVYKKIFNNSVRIEKIYNPLGINPVEGYNLSSKTIVSLGRFDSQKGYENLILAFKEVNKKFLDWKLEIYGNGNYRSKLEKYIEDNNVNNVYLKNAEKDVVKIFNNSAIYVMASRYEGYANTLVEALSCGIPSISYDWLMGYNEIIKDQYNGLVVKLNKRQNYLKGDINNIDIINLSNAIIKLIEDEDLCKKISKNAIKICKTRDKKIIINKWKDIIEYDK